MSEDGISARRRSSVMLKLPAVPEGSITQDEVSLSVESIMPTLPTQARLPRALNG